MEKGKFGVGYDRKTGNRWGTPIDHLWDKDGPYWNLRANGGLLSTAQDLYKWHLALESEKILSKEAKEKYYTPHTPEESGGSSFYGYGWVIQKTGRGTKIIWHNGGNPYFFADFRRYVDENVVVIVGTNSAMQPLQKDFVQVMQSIFIADSSKQ